MSSEPICEVTRGGTVIEVGGDDRRVSVDMGDGRDIVLLRDMPVDTVKVIASNLLYQPVKVTISLHYPDEPLLPF
jgi:hypothetical protein